MRVTATYRLQLGAAFNFAHAQERVGYFARLGVSHLYLSPIVASRLGSTHGYDVIDPTRVDAALGGEAGLRTLAEQAARHEMGLIVDIVPNHMSASEENPYWDDVLERGESSRYAHWFDIDWGAHGATRRRVVLPALDRPLDEVIEHGELSVKLRDGRSPRLVYGGRSFPIDDASLPEELQLATLDAEAGAELGALYSSADGRDRLRDLLDAQHYRLVHWRSEGREINYRRFFDVNDLVALRMEDDRVFDETHALILRLVADGVVAGLRVDHIDGLRAPRRYLERLRERAGPDALIVVEKILAARESLPDAWPVDGTTGYEFLDALEELFIDPVGFADVERHYRRMRRLGTASFRDIAFDAKSAALVTAFGADLDRLTQLLIPLARAADKKWNADELCAGIVSFIAALPVYRTYVECDGGDCQIRASDRETVAAALDAILGRRADGSPPVGAFVGAVVVGKSAGPSIGARAASSSHGSSS